MFNVFLSEEKAKTTLPSSPRKKYKRLIYLLYFIFSTKATAQGTYADSCRNDTSWPKLLEMAETSKSKNHRV